MSTSDLYHMWGCKDFKQLPGTSYGAEGTVFNIEPKKYLLRCPDCGSPNVVRHGSVTRKLLTSQVGTSKRVYLSAIVPIVECKKCHKRRQIDLKIAGPKKSYTNAFAKDILVLLREMSVKAAAEMHSVSWGMIRSILKDYLEKRYPKRNLRNLRFVAIDEIAIGKGHKYFTVVYDLLADEPVYVGDGKGERALLPFWEMLGPRRAKKIKCVSMDMGRAYQAAVRKNLPHAVVVFDRFHVVKLANMFLDDLRRKMMSSKDHDGHEIIKGSRYLLLKNPENLDASRNEPERLQQLLDLNLPLTKMYILKEDLRQFWDKNSREEAEASVDAWIKAAKSSGVPTIVRLGQAIERHKEGILNYYAYQVSSGPLEGFNNKIKVMVRKAYGYRNLAFFKLLILAAKEFSPKKLVGIDSS